MKQLLAILVLVGVAFASEPQQLAPPISPPSVTDPSPGDEDEMKLLEIYLSQRDILAQLVDNFLTVHDCVVKDKKDYVTCYNESDETFGKLVKELHDLTTKQLELEKKLGEN